MNLSTTISPNQLVLWGLSVAVFGMFVYTFRIQQKFNRMQSTFDQLLADGTSGSLQTVLTRLFGRLDQISYNINQLGTLQQEIRSLQRRSLQKKAVIRFNPFEDTGGDLSFAIALLDENDNGFVLSSLHAREGTRVYAKPILSGKSKHLLTEEEKQVLKESIRS